MKRYKSLDQFIDKAADKRGDMFALTDLVRGHKKQPNKRRKTVDEKPIVYVKFNTRRAGKAKVVTLRALLDSGGSGTLVKHQYAHKLKAIKDPKSSKTTWSTPNGDFSTTKQVNGCFVIPELHDNRVIEWKMHVTKDLGAYDMIIGRDMLQEQCNTLNKPLKSRATEARLSQG
jgi:hypothetical protein